jgi:hypothetical protein
MKKISIILFSFFTLVLIQSCYNDIEEELYPSTGPSNCDVTGVTFSTTVTGLFSSYGCMGCHSSSGPSGNVILNTHAGAKTVALSGKLLGAINHSPGFSAMPQGGNKMQPCEIAKIKAWVDAGAPQN